MRAKSPDYPDRFHLRRIEMSGRALRSNSRASLQAVRFSGPLPRRLRARLNRGVRVIDGLEHDSGEGDLGLAGSSQCDTKSGTDECEDGLLASGVRTKSRAISEEGRV
jgi:hypothetical protein